MIGRAAITGAAVETPVVDAPKCRPVVPLQINREETRGETAKQIRFNTMVTLGCASVDLIGEFAAQNVAPTTVPPPRRFAFRHSHANFMQSRSWKRPKRTDCFMRPRLSSKQREEETSSAIWRSRAGLPDERRQKGPLESVPFILLGRKAAMISRYTGREAGGLVSRPVRCLPL